MTAVIVEGQVEGLSEKMQTLQTVTEKLSGPLATQDLISYYASAEGGRVAYNITTGVLALTGTGLLPLAALVNPAGSGKDAFLEMGEFGASTNTTFQRVRSGSLVLSGSGIPASNMGGGANNSALRMYIGGTSSTFSNVNGTVVKAAHIAAHQPYITQLKGRVVLRPGQSLAWLIQGTGGLTSGTASVYFEYWELDAAL